MKSSSRYGGFENCILVSLCRTLQHNNQLWRLHVITSHDESKSASLLNFTKQHPNDARFRVIDKCLHISFSTLGLITNRWNVSATICPRTGAPHKISQHALKWMIRKVNEKPAVTGKGLQEDTKAAEMTSMLKYNMHQTVKWAKLPCK